MHFSFSDKICKVVFDGIGHPQFSDSFFKDRALEKTSRVFVMEDTMRFANVGIAPKSDTLRSKKNAT